MIPQNSTILCGMPPILVVLAMKVLIALHEVTSHLIWPFKEWFILDFLQHLVYWFSEHCVYHLSISRPWLPSKVSLRPVIVVSVWPEIHPLLRDNLSLPLPLLLVFLDPFILINPVNELAHTSSRFPNQRLPQTMLGRLANLESPDGYIIKVTIYLMKHFPVSVWVCFQGLPFMHG